MAGNLTRDEARVRAGLVSVESYDVDLDLTTGPETFVSDTTIRFGCANPGSSTYVDLHGAKVREITLNGRSLDPASHDQETGRIPLPRLASDNELRVVADAEYSRTGEGLHRFVDPVDDQVYLYTQFETCDAHRVYTCFDQPDLKARFELSVTAPENWQVITNNAPDIAEDGRWHFPATPPISTYITALIAGPYHVVRDEYHQGDQRFPMGVFCRASLAEHLDVDAIFEVTRKGFDFYREVFARPYPFDKYDQLFVPEFNLNAMENAGCVTFAEERVFRSRVTDADFERRAEVLLHEMAHMWFGDLVTMRWWDDLWLNESFASYLGVLCQAEVTAWTGAWATFANFWKTNAYRQDQLPSTHPIAADIPDIHAVEVNFDGITYDKGASVLKQLAAYVGHDNFISGVRGYFDRHAWGNTSLADLLDALEKTSGRDLTGWSKEWLETAGVNTLRPSYELGDDGAFTSFVVLQDASQEHPTLRSHRIAIGLYDRVGEDIVLRKRVELDIVGTRTEVPQLTGERRPDLVLVNDDDLAYAKIRFDDHSMRTLVHGIGDFADSLPRALCWSALWDMCRDAELAARDFVRLVLSGIRGVREITVVETLLRQARLATAQYADPAWRSIGFTLLADTLHELVREAEPGSDWQLTYARAFGSVAMSDEHLAYIRGLLDGSVTLDGLVVDTELRWLLLRRLVVRGGAADAEIDAELRRDLTAAGERHAAAGRAAVPAPESKAAAWDRIIGGELPNATFRATLAGLMDADEPELLKPYVERYFVEVGRIWSLWSSDMSSTFAESAYPSLMIDQSTVDRTTVYLDKENPPPALRRLLIEGRDEISRALRARAKDRSTN